MKGICLLSFIPLRAQAASTSEMVSQLLYGETYLVLEKKEDWMRIRIDYDNYEGWIAANQFAEKPEESVDEVKIVHQVVSIKEEDSATRLYPAGAEISNTDLFSPLEIRSFTVFRDNDIHTRLVNLARAFIGTPYLWGGRSCAGIDCSGLMQVVFKVYGYFLPRDAYQQIEQGTEIKFDHRQVGDMAFFEKEGKITHVGIVSGEKTIIHAHGSVREDELTSAGILQKSGLQTHKLHSIKRIVPTAI